MGFLKDVDSWIYTVLSGLMVMFIGFVAKSILQYFGNRKSKISYFEMAYRNVCVDYWNSEGPFYEFDLNNPVAFRNLGEDKIILKKMTITVNGNITRQKQYDEPDIYQTGKSASTKSINFNLSDYDKTLSQLVAEIKFFAENSKGYKYTQTVVVTFRKNEKYNLWHSEKPDSNIKRRWR